MWENSYAYEKNSYTCIMFMMSHIHTHWLKMKELKKWVKLPPQILKKSKGKQKENTRNKRNKSKNQ